MKYLKSFRFWFLVLFLFYTAFGFILIPWFLSNKLSPILKDKIGLHVELGETKFNPYTFRLILNDILLKDLNNKPALSIKQIFVDYSVIALFNNTVLFKDIKIDSPKIYTSLETNGKLNLENILPPSPKKPKKNKKSEPSSTIFKLYKLSITNGSLNFKDLRKTDPFSVDFGPIDFMAHDISTRADDLNSYSFNTKIDNHGELFWEGGMRLSPLKIYGEITAKNISLPKLYKYAISDLEAVLSNGDITLNIPYQIDLSKEVDVSINGASLSLDNVLFINKTTNHSVVDVQNISVDGIHFNLLKKSIGIEKVTISKPNLFTLLNENGNLTIANAFKSKVKKQETKPSQIKKDKWNFHLKDTTINDGIVTFIDNMTNKQIPYNLSYLSINVKNISLDKNIPITYSLDTKLNKKSRISSLGSVITDPFNLKSSINVSNLDSNDFIEYIKPFINFKLDSANISAKAKVGVSYKDALKLDVLSDIDIDNLLINTNNGEKLLRWKKLDIKALHYVHDPMELTIKNINLNEPFVRVHIDEKGKTNFAGLIKDSNSTEKNDNNSSIKFKIGPIKLVNGTSDFSDFSLPFPFKTHIHGLNGDFSTLDFQSTIPANLKLTGKIDEYGYTDIEGRLLPFNPTKDSSLNILFKNIDLTSLTPYSSKFVGYKIKKGKLSMDLKYQLENDKLVGDNKINIDTLTLGEIVKSPHATSLPLEFAIALLKDSDGQIDINMPVKGDINDPDFSYGGVVWRALGNMITGIVAAPFRILGEMMGIDGDKLKAIDFDKGSYKIISTEHEKLENLAKILSKRPSIKLSISGGYDSKIDKYELQKQRFKTLINKELRVVKKGANQDDIYGYVLKSLYIKTFSKQQYNELKKEFTTQIVQKDDDNKTKKISKPKLDVVAFNNEVQKSITVHIDVKKEDLEKLASKRAEAIKSELVKKYKVESSKIEISPPTTQEAKRDRWIESALEVKI